MASLIIRWFKEEWDVFLKVIIRSGLYKGVSGLAQYYVHSAVAGMKHNAEALLQPFPSNALKRCYIHFLSSLNARISCVVACSWIIALCYQTHHNSLIHPFLNRDVKKCKHIFIEHSPIRNHLKLDLTLLLMLNIGYECLRILLRLSQAWVLRP